MNSLDYEDLKKNIGKEINLMCKNQLNYKGILDQIKDHQIYLKNVRSHGTRVEEKDGKFDIEIKAVNSDSKIINRSDIDAFTSTAKQPATPSCVSPPNKPKSKQNEQAKIDQISDDFTVSVAFTVTEKSILSKPVAKQNKQQMTPTKVTSAAQHITSSNLNKQRLIESIDKIDNDIFTQSKKQQPYNQQVPDIDSVPKSNMSPKSNGIRSQSPLSQNMISITETTDSSLVSKDFENVFQCDYCEKFLNTPIFLPCCSKTVCRMDIDMLEDKCVLCKRLLPIDGKLLINEKIAKLISFKHKMAKLNESPTKSNDLNPLDALNENFFVNLINKCDKKQNELKYEIDKTFKEYRETLLLEQEKCKETYKQGQSLVDRVNLFKWPN